MNLRRRRVLWIAFVALAAAATAVVATRAMLGPKAAVVRVAPTEMRQTVVVSGRVLSPARVEIGSVLTGRVAEVPVLEGAQVEAGQVLIRLDTAELAAALAQARAAEASAEALVRQWREVGQPTARQAVEQAAANLAVAEKDARRTQELFAQNFVGQARVDETERAVAVSRAQLESAKAADLANRPRGAEAQQALARVAEARAARELAEARLANATIRSPSAGQIILRAVEPGDVVQPGRLLLSLAVAGETRVSAQIDEKNLALLSIGQRALISADAFPGDRFRGELILLAPAVDPLKGTVEAKFRVGDPPAYLRADMTVSVEVEVAKRANALVVPVSAIRGAVSVDTHVLVAAEERAELRAVRLGAVAGGRAEVVEGLRAGELVVVDPTLRAGQRLRPSEVAIETVFAQVLARPSGVDQVNPMTQQ